MNKLINKGKHVSLYINSKYKVFSIYCDKAKIKFNSLLEYHAIKTDHNAGMDVLIQAFLISIFTWMRNQWSVVFVGCLPRSPSEKKPGRVTESE
jgi:hypothetical protein